MWKEVVMRRRDPPSKHRYRAGVRETSCWVVHINQDTVHSNDHGSLVWMAAGSQ